MPPPLCTAATIRSLPRGRLAFALQMNEKSELFKLDGQVDGNEADMPGQAQDDGSEVENTANAGGDESVRDALGGVGRHRHQRQLRAALANDTAQGVGGVHL